jgi:hypothetical protein
LPTSIRARLNSYRRSISCRRLFASKALALTLAESWLATTAVTKKADRATQFCGSAMVRVPTGGKKKKLKHSMLVIEAKIAWSRPQRVAIPRVASRYVKATVVVFTFRKRKYAAVMTATMTSVAPNWTAAVRRCRFPMEFPYTLTPLLG